MDCDPENLAENKTILFGGITPNACQTCVGFPQTLAVATFVEIPRVIRTPNALLVWEPASGVASCQPGTVRKLSNRHEVRDSTRRNLRVHWY